MDKLILEFEELNESQRIMLLTALEPIFNLVRVNAQGEYLVNADPKTGTAQSTIKIINNKPDHLPVEED
jgi:hypothetical protein